MMLLALAAVFQIHGTNIPDHFRRGDVVIYRRCLRNEENDARERWQGPDPTAPTVVQFGQLIHYCGSERLRAIFAVRGFIQARHPDWSREQVVEAAEFVLTGIDLEVMNERRRPIDDGVHAPPRERF